jgi:hypothetical protein
VSICSLASGMCNCCCRPSPTKSTTGHNSLLGNDPLDQGGFSLIWGNSLVSDESSPRKEAGYDSRMQALYGPPLIHFMCRLNCNSSFSVAVVIRFSTRVSWNTWRWRRSAVGRKTLFEAHIAPRNEANDPCENPLWVILL